jgi:sugar phosphate isomerase/epimerase
MLNTSELRGVRNKIDSDEHGLGMTRLNRREWGRVVASTLLVMGRGALGAQVHRGVLLGVQSYSFRDRPLADAIAGMRAVGLTSCELWQGHVEPQGVSRDEMRRWRETVSLDEFRKIRSSFERAGITLSAYNVSFRDDFSDTEIERGFEMAAALGAPVITASSNVATAARVAPVAARHKLRVGMHNHSKIDPNEFATPDSFVAAMKAGPFIVINLDIGHFTAADFDAVTFIRQHHAHIVTLHIKDRRKAQGPNVALGEGDTPIGPVLRLLRDQKWPIPANIEYEYKGGDAVEEVRRCLEYCKRELDR